MRLLTPKPGPAWLANVLHAPERLHDTGGATSMGGGHRRRGGTYMAADDAWARVRSGEKARLIAPRARLPAKPALRQVCR